MVPSAPGQAQDQGIDGVSSEQAEVLEQLQAKLEAIEEHGMTLEDALRRMQEEERAQAGPPDLVKDLWPAQRVLNNVSEAARSHNIDETLEGLDRMVALNAAITADLPASEVMVHCERALWFLNQDAFNEAGVEMAMAHRAADESKFATLVPQNVISLIQTQARNHIQAKKRSEAIDVVSTVLNICSEHDSLERMTRIDEALSGAREAVSRSAWGVVEAELFEARTELTDLAEVIRLDSWNVSGEETSAQGAEPVDEESGEAGEEPEAGVEDEGEGPADTDEAMEPADEGAVEAGSARPRPRRGSR